MKLLTVSQSCILKKGASIKNFVYKPQISHLNLDKIFLVYDKLDIKPKNNIVMVQDLGKMHYSFYDDGKYIGYAFFGESDITLAKEGMVPKDWFISTTDVDINGNYPVKPSIYINELVIDDRVGLSGDYQQRKSGKKYGTMCFQKILEWAENHGFGSRISLSPGKNNSDIAPNRLYAKLGFEMAPAIIKMIEEVKYKYEQIDGRWVSKGQEVFLTNPDVLINYPLK